MIQKHFSSALHDIFQHRVEKLWLQNIVWTYLHNTSTWNTSLNQNVKSKHGISFGISIIFIKEWYQYLTLWMNPHFDWVSIWIAYVILSLFYWYTWKIQDIFETVKNCWYLLAPIDSKLCWAVWNNSNGEPKFWCHWCSPYQAVF